MKKGVSGSRVESSPWSLWHGLCLCPWYPEQGYWSLVRGRSGHRQYEEEGGGAGAAAAEAGGAGTGGPGGMPIGRGFFFPCIAGRVRDIVGQQRDENENEIKIP